MRAGLLGRYLFRETALVWAASSLVLTVLLMGTIVTRYLSDAATGRTTAEVLPKLVVFSSIQFSVVVLPFSLLIAVMLTLGRLYRDNEMAAMHGAGMGIRDTTRPVLGLAGMVALLTGSVSLIFGPWAVREHSRLAGEARMEATDLRLADPGKFSPVLGGEGVFYAQRQNGDKRVYHDIFIYALNPEGRPVSIIADRAVIEIDPATRERTLVLQDGDRYEGVAGGQDYHITRFAEHGVRISPPPLNLPEKTTSKPIAELLGSKQRSDQVELHWRLTLPVTVLFFALLAVPLAHARPREGRYGRLVIALIIGVVYWNLLVSARYNAERLNALPPGILMWGLQGLMLAAALSFTAWREGAFAGASGRVR